MEIPHLSLDEYRRFAHQVADWMVDYARDVERYPVLSRARPGEVRAALPAAPPERGERLPDILADFERVILPGITHWQHPSFFAYFPANSSPASVLGEMLTAALAVNGMNWLTSPAATELETLVLGWLRQMTALPDSWQGVLQDTASSASLCALLCAREQATGDAINEGGWAVYRGPPLAVYVSDQAHSSIEKGAKIAGFGRQNVRPVPSDGQYAMDADALARAIDADVAAGVRPAFVCATVGTTSSTGIDPLRRIGEIARHRGLWLHVDAALAGNAAILPELRWIFDGMELADSLCFNPHKWLLTNFDCCAMFVRDAGRLQRTFSIQPEYLRTQADDAVINYRDWGIPLGRRFRALKLWFVIRSYGVEGLRAYLREHIRLAQEFAGWVRADPRFEVLAPHPLNTVCFRWRGTGAADAAELDRLNQRLVETLNAGGRMFLTHTRLREGFTIRLAVGQTHTTRRHVADAWDAIREAAARLPGGASS